MLRKREKSVSEFVEWLYIDEEMVVTVELRLKEGRLIWLADSAVWLRLTDGRLKWLAGCLVKRDGRRYVCECARAIWSKPCGNGDCS